jgi:hypothetical protein
MQKNTTSAAMAFAMGLGVVGVVGVVGATLLATAFLMLPPPPGAPVQRLHHAAVNSSLPADGIDPNQPASSWWSWSYGEDPEGTFKTIDTRNQWEIDIVVTSDI